MLCGCVAVGVILRLEYDRRLAERGWSDYNPAVSRLEDRLALSLSQYLDVVSWRESASGVLKQPRAHLQHPTELNHIA